MYSWLLWPALTHAAALQEQAVLGETTDKDSHFGRSVALDGDTAVVGADWENVGLAEHGSAYVFVRHGEAWQQQGPPLSVPGASDMTCFGCAVAVSGDTLLISAQREPDHEGNQVGAVYVFVRTGEVWSQQGPALFADPAFTNGFGSSVTLSGDTAATAGGGLLYVFARKSGTWSLQQQLVPMAALGGFGGNPVLSGNMLVTLGYDGLGGALYAFTRSGEVWKQQGDGVRPSANCAAPPCAATPYANTFGRSLAVSGDTVLVGADGQTAATLPPEQRVPGAAFVFTRNGSQLVQQGPPLQAVGAMADDGVGWSVALSGDTALITAPHTAITEPVNGYIQRGAAYVFTRTAGVWTQQGGRLVPTEGATDYSLGMYVAMSGDTALLGGTGYGARHGAAYVYAPTGAASAGEGGAESVTADAGEGGVTVAAVDAGVSARGGSLGSVAGSGGAVAGGGITLASGGSCSPTCTPSASSPDSTASACGCRIAGEPASNARAGLWLALLALPCMLRRRSRRATAKGQAKS